MFGRFIYDYARPALTGDAVIFGVDGDNACVLLIRRSGEPFQGMWALPGGFVEEGEASRDCALRELFEETGVECSKAFFVGFYDRPGRDPRGWVVSAAYSAVVNRADCVIRAGSDASDVWWCPVSEVPVLAFDHNDVFRDAYAAYCMDVGN